MIEKYNSINSCINKYLEEKLFNRFNINIGIQLISINKKIKNLIKIRKNQTPKKKRTIFVVFIINF
jgi:hypothetical protein